MTFGIVLLLRCRPSNFLPVPVEEATNSFHSTIPDRDVLSIQRGTLGGRVSVTVEVVSLFKQPLFGGEADIKQIVNWFHTASPLRGSTAQSKH